MFEELEHVRMNLEHFPNVEFFRITVLRPPIVVQHACTRSSSLHTFAEHA